MRTQGFSSFHILGNVERIPAKPQNIVHILTGPLQSYTSLKNLWQHLKAAVYIPQLPSNLTQPERFFREEWVKFIVCRYSNMGDTYPKRHAAVIAEKR